MHSLSSLAIIVLAPLTLVVNAGAFVLCLFWLLRLMTLVFVAATLNISLAPAQAGQRIGNGSSAPRLGNTTFDSVTRQEPSHRLGKFEYYNNGMVLPRLGNSCLTPNGTTFCP